MTDIRQRNLPGVSSNEAQFGNWMGGYSPVPVRGTILSVNPVSGTCVVKSEFGNFLPNVALPNFNQDPDGGGGTLDIPRRGQEVLVQFGVSHPTITQFCPASVDLDLDAPSAFRLTEIETGHVLDDGDAANFSGRMPTDGQPGDWAKVGNQGQRIAVLDGGVCAIGSSPWAQIYTIASPEKDLTRIAGRHLQMFSQFGTMEFGEDGGKTWLKLEGGTDQLTESPVEPSNPTFRFMVGGESPGMMSLQAYDRQGASIFENIVDYSGATSTRIRGDLTLSNEGAFLRDIKQSRTIRVLTGDDSISVLNGNRLERYRGSQSTKISGRKTTSVGGNYGITCDGDIALTAARSLKLNAGGTLTAKPGDVAAQWNISNGSLYFEIGNPAALDTGAAQSGFKVSSMGGGNIFFSALRPPSKIILGSLAPDSVILGGDPITGTAVFHAVKWETLMPILKVLALSIDTHLHLAFGTPTAPATVPVSPVMEPLLQLCKSLNVMIGA